MEISYQVDALAREIRRNTHSGKRIGDVLNQMEKEHQSAQRLKANDGKHNSNVDSVAARYTNAPRQYVREAYQPEQFDRNGARAMLVATYPWLDPAHPENPDKIWHDHMAKRTANQVGMLHSAESEALVRYRMQNIETGR